MSVLFNNNSPNSSPQLRVSYTQGREKTKSQYLLWTQNEVTSLSNMEITLFFLDLRQIVLAGTARKKRHLVDGSIYTWGFIK